MDPDNCKVCGFNEMRLIDGYQYCVECGTQNENFFETVVEHTFMDDGTAMYSQVKKIHIQQDKEEMTPEWIKWHTFNFILCGLTEDLIKFGAKPTLKNKVLWIWSRYIQKYKEREEKTDGIFGDFQKENVMPTIAEVSEASGKEKMDGFNWTLDEEQFQKLNEDSDDEWKPDTESAGCSSDSDKCPPKEESKDSGVSITTLLQILSLACNFNGEDIQVSDIYRFIDERRLPYLNCVQRYVPQDLDYRKIRGWDKFSLSIKNFPRGGATARKATLRMCSDLKLGSCVTPNICKLIDRYLNELQLPADLRIHISVVLRLVPYERLLIRNSVHFYEGIALSYIIVTLKILFVLDDDYEHRLSRAAQVVNEKFNFPKVHTTSIFMTSSDRLFTWSEWVQYIEFRKIYLADHYFPVAKKIYATEIGDHLLTSVHNKFDNFNISTPDRTDYADEIIMENLARCSEGKKSRCSEEIFFPASLTPMQTYTKILMETGELTDVKDNVLSESFTSYSLEYVTPDGKTKMCQEIDMGVNTLMPSLENKEVICVTAQNKYKAKFGPETVYVVDCPESSDWMRNNCNPEKDVDWIEVMRDVNEQCPVENKEETLDDPYPLVEADFPEPDPISDESDNEIEEPFNEPNDTVHESLPLGNSLSHENEEARQELINKMLSAVSKKYRIYTNTKPRVLRKRKAKECNGSEEKKIPIKRVKEVGALSVKEEINSIISNYLERLAAEDVEKSNEDKEMLDPVPKSYDEVSENIADETVLEPPITENEVLPQNNHEDGNQKIDDIKYTAAWWDEQEAESKNRNNKRKAESFRNAAKRTAHLVDMEFKKEVEDHSEMCVQNHFYWLVHHNADYMPDKTWFSKSFYWLLKECCSLIDCKHPIDLYNEVKKLEIYLTLACNSK